MPLAVCVAQMEEAWVQRFGGAEETTAHAQDVAVNSAGSIYVVGSIRGPVGHGLINPEIDLIKYGPSGNVLWSKQYVDGFVFETQKDAVALDGSGNVYVLGGIDGDVLLIKYDGGGTQQWVRRYENPRNEAPVALSVDAAGNAYIAAQEWFDDAGNYDIETLKYDADGNLLWQKIYSIADKNIHVHNLAIDNGGNSYLTGDTGEDSGDFITLRYDGNGNLQWASFYDGSTLDGANAIAVDASGSVYVTGYSLNAANQLYDFATVKYSANGAEQWVRKYDNGQSDKAIDIAIDGSGKIVVTGTSDVTSAPSWDNYATIKYDAAGNMEWIQRYAENYGCEPVALTIDGSGNIYVTGTGWDAPFSHYATVKYNAAGIEQWVARYDNAAFPIDDGEDVPSAIAVHTDGSVYVTGRSEKARSENFQYFDFATIRYVQTAGTPITFTPIHDSYVKSSSSTSNFATQTGLKIRKSSSEALYAYLKFTVAGITGAIQSATLRLYVTDANPDGGAVYSVSNNYLGTSTAWVQSGLNWNNAPAISGAALSNAGAVSVGQWVEFNVTAAVTGNGTYSFGLKNNSSDVLSYRAKEGSNKPELVIVTGSAPTLPRLSIDNVTVMEGNSGTTNANFTVSLSAASTQTVTVIASTQDGNAVASSDYQTIASQLITFPPMTTSQIVTVMVNGDLLDELNENFYLNLSNPVNATITDSQGIGTIVDDDETSGGITVVFTPTNDAYVRSSTATTNYGTLTALKLRKSGSETLKTYLKFTVTGITGSIQSAKLRLFVTDASPYLGAVYSTSNNYLGTSTPWVQGGLNWNNAPEISGTALSSVGAFSVEQWVELNVTPAISGNGTYSFALTTNASDLLSFSAKEGLNKPELVIKSSGSSIASLANNSVAEKEALPEQFSLSPNYPNPFNAGTTIVYALPQEGSVRLVIYNMLGQMVRKLVHENQIAGHKRVLWDGNDERGLRVSSGVYFYRIEFGQQRLVGKMILQQ